MPELELNDQNFEQEVLKEEKLPVLVDFSAEWCGPCKIQGPIVEEVAQEIEGKAKVGKLEIDQSPKIAEKFAIRSIPTVAIFKKGEIVWQQVGLQSKEALLEALKKHA